MLDQRGILSRRDSSLKNMASIHSACFGSPNEGCSAPASAGSGLGGPSPKDRRRFAASGKPAWNGRRSRPPAPPPPPPGPADPPAGMVGDNRPPAPPPAATSSRKLASRNGCEQPAASPPRSSVERHSRHPGSWSVDRPTWHERPAVTQCMDVRRSAQRIWSIGPVGSTTAQRLYAGLRPRLEPGRTDIGCAQQCAAGDWPGSAASTGSTSGVGRPGFDGPGNCARC